MGSEGIVKSLFTTSTTRKGPSEGIMDKDIGQGQVLKSAYGQDNVHGYEVENVYGGKMGGSDDNLGHSLTGTSAVQITKGARRNVMKSDS